MDFDICELNKRVVYEQNGNLNKRELGSWSEKAYYDLLKGGFLEIKKLVLFPFLKVLSRVHIENNDRLDEYASSEEDIEFIRKVLKGYEKYTFAIEIGTPIEMYDFFSESQNFDEARYRIYKVLETELRKTDYNKWDIREIASKILGLERRTELLFDYLEQKINEMLNVIISDTGNSSFYKEYNLCVKNAERNRLYNQLEKYVRCRVGECNFTVLVCFEKGEPSVNYYI